MNALEILWQYREAFSQGFMVTAALVGFTSAAGTTGGIAAELLAVSLGDRCRRFLEGVAFCVAATPPLAILFWFYYPAQVLLGVSISPFLTALTALSLVSAFSVYRMVADARRDLPAQYSAAARVCGLTTWQVFFHIQLPLLMRSLLPRWVDHQVVILQTSLFASLISVEETFRVAQRINSVVYAPVVIYTSMALLFMAAGGGGMYLARHLRKQYDRDISER